MSRLFTDPKSLCYRSQIITVAVPDPGRESRSRIAMQLNSAPILPYVAFNKDAFPNRQHTKLAGPNHSAWQNKLRFSCVNFQAQYQAFVRFAVASGAALKSHRA
jgi:hypothetical protein